MRASQVAGWFALLFVVSHAGGAEKLTQADLLWRLIDLDRLMSPPPPGERTTLFSSFDRASQIDNRGNLLNWHADNDQGQFLHREPDGWNVMAEMTGPGAITQMWVAHANEQFRVVIDGNTVIDAPLADLFSGKLPPFTRALAFQTTAAGGFKCYFPIACAKSCRVLTRATDLRYQIDYVEFGPETQVEPFTRELNKEAQAALEAVSKALTLGLSPAQILGDGPTMTVAGESADKLKRGDKLSESIDGAGAIRALHVAQTSNRPPRTPYALRHYVLRLYWDGESRPSVEAPLADFFGSGFERRPYNSLVMGTNDWTALPGGEEQGISSMYCYFPMPFAEGARVEIENAGGEELGLMFYLRVSRTPPPKDSLRFKAKFRRDPACRGLDYAVLETAGRGRVVGCTLAVDCPRSSWWGAGDQKVWVDGPFPAYFGTGTADYFGSIAGLPETVDPLAGVTWTGPFGKFAAYRWQITDCIDFHQVVHFAFGNLQPNDAEDTYYSSVAYWYGERGEKDFFEPLTAEVLTPPGLRIANAVEIEGNVRGGGWGGIVKQKYAGGEELSGRAAARIVTSALVQINIPYDAARHVRLKLRVHPRRPFESIEVRAADGHVIGIVPYRRTPMGIHTVGEMDLKPGDNVVTVICKGAPVLDCWIIEPIEP